MPVSTWDLYTTVFLLFVLFFCSFTYSLAGKNIVININNSKLDISKLFYFVSLLTIILVVGLQKSNSDYDSYSYLFKYEYGRTLNLFQTEYIFKFLNYIVYQIIGEYKYLTLLMAFITYIFFYKSVDYYVNNLNLSRFNCMLMLLTLYMLVSFGMLRQICAASISMYSLRYLKQKNLKMFLLFFLIAFGFHVSSIFLLIIAIAIYPYKSNKVRFFCLLLIVILYYSLFLNVNFILSFFNDLSSRDYSLYSESTQIGLGNLISRLPIVFLLFVFRGVINKSNDTLIFLVRIIIFEILTVFSYYIFPILGGRIIYFVLFCRSILIPFVLKNGIKEKKFGTLVIILYCLYYFFNQLITTSWITEFLMPIEFDI
ncbi:EpsG family protein [[Clostridium] spiroforme]|nr:EpsG family protein [Thomasclavelia spiroformis]